MWIINCVSLCHMSFYVDDNIEPFEINLQMPFLLSIYVYYDLRTFMMCSEIQNPSYGYSKL